MSAEQTGLRSDWNVQVRRFYDKNAADYCRSTVGLDMSAQRALFAGQLPSGARVLDLGCGSGRDLKSFLGQGFAAIGIDLSPRMAEWAASYVGASVAVGDTRAIPFSNLSFDGVWCSAALHHLPRTELGQALGEIHRILKRDGATFISIKRGIGQGRDPDGRPFTYVTDREWRRLLTQAGFRIIKQSGPGDDPVWISTLARKTASS